MSSLRAHGLAIRRGGRDVILDATFELGPGLWLLQGENGSGKSTLLRVLAGVGPAHKGTVEVAGHDLEREPVRARRHLGYLPQSAEIFGYLRVREFLETVAALRGAQLDDALLRATALIHDRCPDQRIDTLSAGQRRKLCLCAALCGDPAVLLLDEPDAALDAAALGDLAAELGPARQQGRVVLVASHHPLPGVAPTGLLTVVAGRIRVDKRAEG